jgi:NhaA family Na+:H+ antiporter
MLKSLKHTLLHPLKKFIHDSKSIGIVLLICTLASLLFSNFSFSALPYQHFWEASIDGSSNHHFHISFLSIPNTLLVFINDFLMAFFFFLAGMEIKRELLDGELASLSNSLLPAFAAIGGMLAPAILFALFNKHTAYIKGWAIPTATDIAFTIGVASLLGNRVPTALKIFITALAIIDDLGAIIVIALFYGGDIHISYLLAILACIALLLLLNKIKKSFGIINVILGLLLWYCMFNSGLHATIAGVIFAFLIPQKRLSKFELNIHTPVYFFIIPLFALANTAININISLSDLLTNSLSWGIIVGLVFGKPLGICLACYVLIKKKFAKLPTNTSWMQLIGASILAGIGFTMSIFIATLAFHDKTNQDFSKISILIASCLAIIIGFVWLKFTSNSKPASSQKNEQL